MWLFAMLRAACLLLAGLSLAACISATGETMPNKPVLARLEIPDQTLLLYENMSLNTPDRTGNWRFMFRQDGCFFNARNTQLWLTGEADFQSDDPALFWNTPFSTTPDRCLTEAQQAELKDTIRQINFFSLDSYYPSDSLEEVSSHVVERWTVVQNGKTHTVVVEEEAAPPQLIELRAVIDQLVANAPRADDE